MHLWLKLIRLPPDHFVWRHVPAGNRCFGFYMYTSAADRLASTKGLRKPICIVPIVHSFLNLHRNDSNTYYGQRLGICLLFTVYTC